MLKWKLVNNHQVTIDQQISEVIDILLKNRGINTKEEIDEFLFPKLESVTIDSVNINKDQLKKTIERIQKAINKKEQIVVFGDYDVDGITGTAILWEILFSHYANVMPYIPHRVGEGYGLSVKGIENVVLNNNLVKLIITVDNGIVANEAVDFANSQGIDVIITDHHTIGEKLPNAYSIVHTTKLCGAGVAYLLTKEILNFKSHISDIKKNNNVILSDSEESHSKNNHLIEPWLKRSSYNHLDLVALATVADLVPLTGANRIFLKSGLSFLQNTTRPGLLALFKEAQIDPKKIGVYEIGHIIGPRLNAMGRLESAMDSLRLVCTKDPNRAGDLAIVLGETNRNRQLLTKTASLHAVERINDKGLKIKKILFLAENYEEGIIGLVAGKLVDTFYRPSIVLSKGNKISKASARSVKGFNIIEFIRKASHLLINAGGHPMAAGFTVETEKISLLKEFLELNAENLVTSEHLTREISIDLELPLQIISQEFFNALESLAPFGMGNREPIFLTKKVVIADIRLIGKDKNHIKFKIKTNGINVHLESSRSQAPNGAWPMDSFQVKAESIEAIGFNLAEKAADIKPGDLADIVYSIGENEWNGKKTLQLNVKDLKIVE